MTRSVINDTNVGPDTAPQAFDKCKANFVLCDTDTANIAINAAGLQTLTTNLAASNTNIAANAASIVVDETNITALQTTVATHTTQIATNVTNITTATTNITALQSAIGAITTNIALASGTGAAAANTASIQAALNTGGVVNLTQPGLFYVNATLIHGGNTLLILGANTKLQHASGTNATMLTSTAAAAYLAGGTSITLTQGTNNAVTVGWTAHGLVAGQGVVIGGAAVSAYNGTFRIAAIINANSFTIYTKTYATAAPGGTPFAVQAIQNFGLVGGTWNKDSATQGGTPATSAAHAINFFGLLDCVASDVIVMNANKYAFCVCACEGFRWWDLEVNGSPNDGIKIYGPTRTLIGDGAAGFCNTDFLSLETKEPPATIAWQISGGGDIFDLTVRNINAEGGTATVAVYPSDAEIMDGIVFDQVQGSQSGIGIGNASAATFTANNIGQLTFRNISVMAGIVTKFCTIDQLIIPDSPYNPMSTTVAGNATFLGINSASSIINELVVERIKINNIPSTAGNTNFILATAGTIGRVVLRDVSVKGTAGNQINLITFNGASVGEVLVDGGIFDSSLKYIVFFSAPPASGTPIITLRNVQNGGTGCISNTGVMTGTVKLLGNTFTNNTLGVVRPNGAATWDVRSDGANKFVGTSPVFQLFSSPIVTAYGWDLVCDATTGLQTTKGQYFTHFHSGGAANTLGPCLAVDGTHFYALGTGTGGVNTLII